MKGKLGKRQIAFLAAMQKDGAQVWRKGSGYVCVVNGKKRSSMTKLSAPSVLGLVRRKMAKITADGIIRRA